MPPVLVPVLGRRNWWLQGHAGREIGENGLGEISGDISEAPCAFWHTAYRAPHIPVKVSGSEVEGGAVRTCSSAGEVGSSCIMDRARPREALSR